MFTLYVEGLSFLSFVVAAEDENLTLLLTLCKTAFSKCIIRVGVSQVFSPIANRL